MFGRRGTVLLLLGMAAWIVAAFAGGVVAVVVAAVATGAPMPVGAKEGPGSPAAIAYAVAVTAVFQAILLGAAALQGRRLGAGDRCAGLGAGPVRRKRVVALLGALMLGWGVALMALIHLIPALRDFARSVTPAMLAGAGDAGLVVTVARLGLIALLAPLAEELFFRGWLWEALRHRRHGPAATMALTALPWLLLHGLDAPGRILFLIPSAVLLSLARCAGGSVRASLAVHIANNGFIAAVQTLGTLAGEKA